jgi:hypothetical protein
MPISPHHVTNAAIKGIADDVAERLGKHRSGIYAMGEDPEKDRYSRLVQFWLILADLNFAQADLIFRDFEARRNALCPARKGRQTTEQKALSALSESVSQLMKAYFEEKAEHEKLQAVAEVEEVCRQLSGAILRSSERGMLQEQRP